MGSSERIFVAGAGIVGLTTALRLLRAGLAVDVAADRYHPATTGSLSAGLWYPYKVGGSRVAHWALSSLAEYQKLADAPESGVRLVRCISSVPAREPIPFWADADVDYSVVEQPSAQTERKSRKVHARLPVAIPSLFLPWLESQIVAMGGTLKRLDRPIRNLSEVPGRIVVNCTGLGARGLCSDDSVVPIRGVVVRVAGTGIEDCITDDIDPEMPTYVIPNGDYCVLGGSAQADRWDVTVSRQEVDEIVDRCARLDGRVRRGVILGAFAGLRPGRREVRLETEDLDDGRLVVHNYGHGGSGFTLAWGCAEEVTDIVSRLAP